MKRSMTFIGVFAGTAFAMYVITALALVLMGITPQTAAQSGLDLSASLLGFRLSAYALVLISWKWIINRFIRSSKKDLAGVVTRGVLSKWRPIAFNSGCKLALFLAVFELVAIQQILGDIRL